MLSLILLGINLSFNIFLFFFEFEVEYLLVKIDLGDLSTKDNKSPLAKTVLSLDVCFVGALFDIVEK